MWDNSHMTLATEPELPTGTSVVLAAQTLGSIVRRTPLEYSARLSRAVGRPVYLKREDVQVGRSYKVRGAYNFISSLTPEEAKRGVVAASAGNHAQGVAYACNKLGITGTIFIPATTPRQKRHRIRDIGGSAITLIEAGATFDETNAAAIEYAEDAGAIYVHPFDDLRTIAGQGTVVKEIFEQAGQPPAAVLVPVGGGGLLAGTLAWVKQFHPEVEVIGVEPSGAASLQAALEAGEPVTLPRVNSFADGTAVARVGDTTFAAARKYVDRLVTVPEGALSTEMLNLYQVEGIITEPSGALAPAALRFLAPSDDAPAAGSQAPAAGPKTGAPTSPEAPASPQKPLPDGPIACIISGGNNDVSRYADIVQRSMVYEGLRHYFLVTFPQKPGALRLFLDEVLSDGEDIVLFEYTKKNNRETGPALVGIEIDDPASITSLLARMEESELNIEKLEPDSPAFKYFL